jgi:hypothetical protein
MPLEKLLSYAVDMGVFRFHCWQRVWYWDPQVKWPSHQWRHGRFLGCCFNEGDLFIDWILPDKTNQI